MSWGHSSHYVPHLASYARAKREWDDTKPLRERGEYSDRPLGDRANRARWIGKRGDAYAARLYSTDVVTYHADETITLCTGGWASKATASFIHAVSPVGAELFDENIWAHMNGKTYVVDKCLTIKRDENGQWQPVDPQVTQYYRLDKERCKAVRTSFKPFVEYAKAMFKLGGGKPYRMGNNVTDFDLADESTYYRLFIAIGGWNINDFRKALWVWVYENYDCWDTLDAPLGAQIKRYP